MLLDPMARGVAHLRPPKGRAAYLFKGRYYDVSGNEVPNPDAVQPEDYDRQAPTPVDPPPEPAAAPVTAETPSGPPKVGAEAVEVPDVVGTPDAAGVGVDADGTPNFEQMDWKTIREAYKQRFGRGVRPGMTQADVLIALRKSYED